jgi:phage terminase small subunit
MVGPLRNHRHEAFCQFLMQGESVIDAHARAGFARSDANSSRLKSRPKVAARLAELQAEVAKENKVTVESICKELDEANAVAKAKGQAAAMVSASALRAKLAGLMVDKVEVGPAGAFDKCDTVEAVVDEVLRFQDPFHPATKADRKGLIALYERHMAEVSEFLASIKARPINPEVAHKARYAELKRIGNGKSH